MYIRNINNIDYIKVNDTATQIQLKIFDSLNNPFDLKSAMQVFVVIGNHNGRILTKIPDLLDDTGVLEFGLDNGDLIEVGHNLLEVHIIMPNGEKFVAPSKGYYKLSASRSIDSLGEEVTTVTLDYFLEEANRALDQMNTKVEYVNQTTNDLRQEVATAIQYVDDTVGDLRQEVGENLDSLVTQEVDNKMTPFVEDVNEQLAQNLKQVTETDYVDMLRKMTYFTDITLVKTHDGDMQQFDVYLKNADIQQKMTFVKPDDYFKLSGIRVSPTDYTPVNMFVSVGDLNYTGDWYLGDQPQHIRYARSVGATATYAFSSTTTTDITFRHYSDDRGGVLRVTLDGDNPVDISTYSATPGTKEVALFNDVPPGNHTIRLEFIGDDPDNAPRDGVSRGWLFSQTASGVETYVFDIIGEETSESGEVLLMSDTSNKEFAFSIAPIGSTNFQWIPQHETRTGVKRSEPIFILDGVQYSISDFNIGQEYDCKDFKLIQDIYGRNPDSGTTNLVNVKTIHSITLDGNINVSGSMRVLEDIQISSSYVIMAPVNNGMFDLLQTGWGNQYETTKADGTSTTLTENAGCGNYIYLSKDDDYYVAYRHTDKRGNFDISGQSKKDYQNFVNHRDDLIVKHYINIFDNQVLPAGYKYRWSGDFIVGKLKGVYDLMLA